MTLTLAQLREAVRVLERSARMPDDAFVAASRDAYVAVVRATVRDPYERALLLFNAGCRGADLR